MIKTKNKIGCFVILFFAAMPYAQAFKGGTSIGDGGGDPLFHFLEATRISFVETVRIVAVNPAEQDVFCRLPNLSAKQTAFCLSFVKETAQQMMQMNRGTSRTAFVLRDEPLMVEGPDGKPMSVAARTAIGPAGVVEFHRDSIRLMGPQYILMLMAHEFGHKVAYKGNYVEDNPSLGTDEDTGAPLFASGRQFLDTMAAAFVDTAKRRGLLGAEFLLRDRFECRVAQAGGQPVGLLTTSPRLFKSENRRIYETGFGKTPLTRGPYIFEPLTNSTLEFKANISEPDQCSDNPEAVAARKMEIRVVRGYPATDENPEPREETVVEETMNGYNPLCEKEPKFFGLTVDNIHFSCRYFGAEGNTSSFLKPKK